MGMTAGTCAIATNSDGTASITGTGAAVAIATALVTNDPQVAKLVPLPSLGQKTAPFSPAMPATAALIAAQKASVSAIYAHHQGQANSIAVLVTYIKSNGAIAVTVPAAGINDSTAHACTGTASGTGTIS